MKYTITIEETNVKDFVIEAETADAAYEIAQRKYEIGELMLDPGECQFRQIAITKPSNECTEWQEF